MLYQGQAFRVEMLPDQILNVVFDLKDQAANVFNALSLKELAEALEIVRS